MGLCERIVGLSILLGLWLFFATLGFVTIRKQFKDYFDG